MFGFLPHNLFTNHVGQNSQGLSPRLWSQVSGTLMASDGAKRLFLAGDDFTSWDVVVAESSNRAIYSSGSGTYISWEDSSCTPLQTIGESGGVIGLVGPATNNLETWLQYGQDTTVLGAISDTAGADFMTAFECRVKVNSIVDDVNSIFCGLAGDASGAALHATKLDNSGIMRDIDYIGFDTVHVNSGTTGTNAKVNFVYNLAGATAVEKISTCHTLVADEYVKLGFIYDPDEVEAKRIKVYVDNEENATYVTKTNIATSTGSAFPDAQFMSSLFGVKSGTGTVPTLSIDWWAYAQVIR